MRHLNGRRREHYNLGTLLGQNSVFLNAITACVWQATATGEQSVHAVMGYFLKNTSSASQPQLHSATPQTP